MKQESIQHPFAPIYDKHSKILILGTFPSVKSREVSFYYGHPQNRFWKVLSQLTGETLPQSIEEKRAFLLRHGIALWDVLASCEIKGSSDSSIRYPIPNDLSLLLEQANIQKIFTNGKKAQQLYEKYLEPNTNIKAHCLPSTSPANRKYHLEDLLREWKIITDF
ncbi:MAG: DNA-deoxyinosine glycosylase [Bacillota bacterium]|nr:DNA-deoxyinosine glycosylase [Bacillota bacterium]